MATCALLKRTSRLGRTSCTKRLDEARVCKGIRWVLQRRPIYAGTFKSEPSPFPRPRVPSVLAVDGDSTLFEFQLRLPIGTDPVVFEVILKIVDLVDRE